MTDAPNNDFFATEAELGQYLRVSIPNGDQFALLLIASATQLIRDYTRQHISLMEDDTVYIDGSGSDTVLLPDHPAVSVDEVIENVDTDNPRTLLDGANGSAAEFDFNADEGILIRRHGQFVIYENRSSASFGKWPSRRKSIQVKYTHGYEIVPASVRLICVTVAARGWAQDGATVESTGGYSATYAGQPGVLTKDEMRVLDKYRARRK